MASPQPSGQQTNRVAKGCLWAIVGGAAIACAGLLGVCALIQAMNNNQITPVLPPGAPPPVVPQLPNITAALMQGKDLCEERAGEIKAAVKAGRVKPKDLQHGRELYGNAKAASDACIIHLKTGLARRFTEEDPKDVLVRLDAADGAMLGFTLWADDQLRPKAVGAVGPWGEAANMLVGWIKALQGQNDQNDRALNMLRDDLESCRLREWDKIGD
jgi:hypothetical protein